MQLFVSLEESNFCLTTDGILFCGDQYFGRCEKASQVTYRYIVVAVECNYIVCADAKNAPRINTSFYGVQLDRRRDWQSLFELFVDATPHV